jgi:hypothetical protein
MILPTNVETVNADDVAANITPPSQAPSFVDIRLDPTNITQSNTAETAQNPTTTKPGKFDPSRLRFSQGFEAGATSKTYPITARKPERHTWFMAHPDPAFHFVTMVLDFKAEREIYLVEPELREELGAELTPKVIVPCITRQNNIFLWPVSLPDDSGRVNRWTNSATDAVEEAMHGWIRLVANMEAGGYVTHHPRVQIDLPTWPDLTLEAMLEKAFKHYMIDSLEHPRIRALYEVI